MVRDRLAPSSVQQVLILRPDNLGDLILFSGALRHIRAHYSGAKITICAKRYTHNYLELCPYVDRLMAWEDLLGDLLLLPELRWFPEIRGKWHLRRYYHWITQKVMARRYAVDVLLVPLRSPTGGEQGVHTAVRVIPARAKYGIAGDWANQTVAQDKTVGTKYSERMALSPIRYSEHELSITRDFLEFLGLDVSVPDIWPELWTDEGDRRFAQQRIPPSSESVRLALCPGSQGKHKQYPPARYREVLERLSEWKFDVYLFGSTGEKQLCDAVEEALACCDNVTGTANLGGRTSVRELIESLRRCDLVLSVDSAAMHIATALNKPVVGIIGGGHYGRFYPWGDAGRHLVACSFKICYWCNWECPFSKAYCIEDIEPADIASQLRTLLLTIH